MDPYETTVFPLTTVFTPPASCSSSWTYEGSYYNSVPGGILIQNALLHSTDSNCFPSGFTNAGRGTASDLLSPGYCPHGYTSPAIFQGGTATTAICCLSNFVYTSTLTTIQGMKPVSSAIFAGCVSSYPASSPATAVLARSGNTDLGSTTISGNLTMWAQAITVAYEQKDMSLFTTSAATMSSTGAGPSTISMPVIPTATAKATSSSSSSSSPDKSNNSTGLSPGAKAGIGIGVSIGGLIILALLAFLLVSRRRRRQHQLAQAADSTTPSNGVLAEADADATARRKYVAEMEQRDSPVPVAEMDAAKHVSSSPPVRYELQG